LTTARAPTELRYERLTVTAAGRALLSGVELGVRSGELVAIVGPNGAGKTTLLRAALGLARPSAGHATLDSRDVRSMTPRERAAKLAWLPQHPRFGEPLTATEVVAAARYRFAENRALSTDAAQRALLRAGAGGLAERLVTELSGGERQRVALAALLAQEAPLLLLDEPANHLDPAQQIDAYELIGALWRDGLGILCVTHDVNLLAHVGDSDRVRVVGLCDGRIRFDLSYDSPELPGELGKLFGLELRVLDFDGRRLLLASQRTRELR
jgi:iron complex transport system ATP-binding protein